MTVSISHWVEFVLLKTFQAFLKPLSWKSIRRLARALGRFLFLRAGFRRQIVLDNLSAAYPELSVDQRMAFGAQSFESVAVTLVEFMLFSQLTREELARWVSIENPEVVRKAVERRKGVLLLTAHYGSWELFAQSAGLFAGVQGLLLMKIQSNRLVSAEVEKWRTRFGLRTIPSTIAVREILHTLREGGWVVIAADQSAARESISVPFFGRGVPTFQGPASFALRTGAEILLGVARRRPDDTYTIRFERIPHEDLSGHTDENVRILTERHAARTEALIRRDPGQWMWMHKRWKHVQPTVQSPEA